MKRLITTAFLSLLTVLAVASPAAAVERWKFQMFDPAATSNRTLNIEYKVLSISDEDVFTVKLYQNGTEVASQNITTDFGDSGVFNVSLPATGTYQYKTVADNSNDPANKEETRTVEITNAPQPTVVTVNNGAAAGGAGGGGANAANAAGGGAGATTDGANGQVTDDAASTDEQNSNQDVLGAETKEEADKANSRRRNWYAAGILAVVAAAAAAYYMLVVRRSDA